MAGKVENDDQARTINPSEISEPDQAATEIEWPDPAPEMLASPRFEAIWQCIKRWDINAPAYNGYMGATGNHVRAILDALDSALPQPSSRAADRLTCSCGGLGTHHGDVHTRDCCSILDSFGTVIQVYASPAESRRG